MALTLSDETTKAIIKELARTQEPVEGKPHKYEEMFTIGAAYLIRSVTHYNLGIVAKVFDDGSVLMSRGGWMCDTGRFSIFLTEGQFADFELSPTPFVVHRGAMVDHWPWLHAIPTETK